MSGKRQIGLEMKEPMCNVHIGSFWEAREVGRRSPSADARFQNWIGLTYAGLPVECVICP